MQRKVLADGGATLEAVFALLEADVATGDDEFGAAMRGQLNSAREAIAALVDGRDSDPEWPLRVADDVLRALGFMLLAWAWARIARAARADGDWHEEKRQVARFGVQWLLPEANMLWLRVRQREVALPPIRGE